MPSLFLAMSPTISSFFLRRSLSAFATPFSDVPPSLCYRVTLARAFSSSPRSSFTTWPSHRTPAPPSRHRSAPSRPRIHARAASALTAKATLPSEIVKIKRAPSVDDLEEAEMDAEPLAPGDVQLRMTDRAAEVRKALLNCLSYPNTSDTGHS